MKRWKRDRSDNRSKKRCSRTASSGRMGRIRTLVRSRKTASEISYPLFESAAEALQGRVIAVVLTGYDSDGTDGVRAVKGRGGIVIAQDEKSSAESSMPRSAIATGVVDRVLTLDRIPAELLRLAKATQ